MILLSRMNLQQLSELEGCLSFLGSAAQRPTYCRSKDLPEAEKVKPRLELGLASGCRHGLGV